MRTRKAQSQLEEILEYRRRTAVPPPKKSSNIADIINCFGVFLLAIVIMNIVAHFHWVWFHKNEQATPWEQIHFHHYPTDLPPDSAAAQRTLRFTE